MPKQEVEKKPAGDVEPIKEAIQSLAHQLWLGKRHTTGGVDWLVDGRLSDQLNELSRSELVRIKRLLLRKAVQIPSDTRYMTARPA